MRLAGLVLVGRGPEGVLDLVVGHVVGDGQDGHTLVEVGHADGLVHDGGQGFGAGDQLVVDCHVIEELGCIDLLEVSGVEQVGLDLTEDGHHGHMVHLGIVESVEHMDGPGVTDG